MKKLFQILVVLSVVFCSILTASAASAKNPKMNKKAIITTTYATTLDCRECEKKVMNILPYKRGVKDVEIDFKKRYVTVKYDNSKCSDRDIIKALAKLDIEAKVKSNKPSNSGNRR